MKIFTHPNTLGEFTPRDARQHIEDVHHHIKGCKKSTDIIYADDSLMIAIEEHRYHDTKDTFLWIFQRNKMNILKLSS